MASLKLLRLIVPGLLVLSLGGCPLNEPVGPEPTQELDTPRTGPDQNTHEGGKILEQAALAAAEGNQPPELARSEGSTSISIDPRADGSVPPPADTGADFAAGGTDGTDDGAVPQGDSAGSGGSGDMPNTGGGSPCEPDRQSAGWPGELYCGQVDVTAWEWLDGYGELTLHFKTCLTVALDEQGVPAAIPIPCFAFGFGYTVQVDAVEENQTATYHVWQFTVTTRVLSAEYTPTTADAVIELSVEFTTDPSVISAHGVHEVHMELRGNTLYHESHTAYEGHFCAGPPEEPDWEANAAQTFDVLGTLLHE